MDTKDLNYYKNNCEEDYIKTPISVLRYITELEQALQLLQTDVVGRSEQLCDFEHHNADIRRAYTCSECGGMKLK